MRRRKFRRNRLSSDFAVKLTNVRRGMRIRDLKAELRRRECNPLKITWKGIVINKLYYIIVHYYYYYY